MFKIQESKTVFLFIILIVLIIYCNAHPQPQTSSNDIHKNDNIEQRVKRESDENPENPNLIQELTSTEELPFLVSLIRHLIPGVNPTIVTVIYNFVVKVFKHIRDNAHNNE
ncbi:Protein of unknown function [Cotesia congregata]|uniref:Secreted protein n=1 Tax=Cotesia congregata TaxID=51543 RepID=A0A8J2HAE6_COTCN|nr:Protein of unknown function [Cotesia congregata]